MNLSLRPRHLLALLFIALGLYGLYLTYTTDIFFTTGALGPMDYPQILLYIWLFLSIFYLIIPRQSINPDPLIQVAPLLAKVILAATLYVVFLPWLGFICTSIAFFMLFFYFFQDRRYGRMALVSILSTLILWTVFEIILSTPLPAGFWEDILYS